jgi:long-chain acyl-CoA synthetase
MNLIDLLRDAARRFPDKPALICLDRSITYQELHRAAQGIARWFIREGLQPGDRVAVHGTNTIETAELLLACFHAGLIAVPVNVRLKSPEIAYIINHSEPRMCFTQPALAPAMEGARAEAPGMPMVYTQPPEPIDGPDLPAPAGGTLAVIMYTSGTTARPKGVTHTHDTLTGSARAMWPTGVNHSATLIVATPMMHATGMNCTTFPGLMAGATVVLIPAFDPGLVLDAIERHRCTFGLGLPAMMQLVAKEQEEKPRDVSSLKTWLAGGDSVPVSLQERFGRLFGIPLQEGYAMTESVIIAWNRPDAVRNGSIGTAADGVELRVELETGELAVRSPSVFVGYWKDPEATANTLVDGWLMTGDLVRCDPDGYIWFQGRRKEVIIRGGSNISPQEVEEALYRHPAVMEVGVIGVPDQCYGECVVACVSLRAGKSASEEELKQFARARLADYKVPDRIEFLSELPKGITGKVQRRALKEMAAARTAAQ